MPSVPASDINSTAAAPVTTPAVTPVMAAAIQSQQLERLNMTAALKADPGMFTQYQKNRVKQIMGKAADSKTATFQKAHAELNRAMNAQQNASMTANSTLNMGAMTDAILKNNANVESAIEHDKLLSKRQFEINEWSNYNKLDTLFYLQLFFMCSLMAAIIMYLVKANVMSMGMASLFYIALGLIVVIVGVARYYYTANTRDRKLWHRRYFPAAPDPGQGAGDNCPTINVNIPFEERVASALNSASETIVNCSSQVLGSATGALDQFGSAAANEALNIAYGNTSSLNNLGTSLAAAGSCAPSR